MNGDSIESLARLKEQFQKLPGIGARSAERLAFHILRERRDYAEALSQAILDVKDKVINCSRCFNLTEADPCRICNNTGRDQGELWVVEQPKDVVSLESTGLVQGVYHVLLGHISPLEGIEPEDLTIEQLIKRVTDEEIREVILALNPTVDGDGTALYLQDRLKSLDVAVTRPARGLAVGSQIEYASASMLEAAIKGRTQV